MDRQIVYPGSIPLDTDFLQVQRNVMIALGVLTRAVLGTDLVVDGLACAPGAGLAAIVGPGSVTTFSVVDQAAFGSLGADGRGLCKTGQVLVNTLLTVQAPAAGVQVWLVEAQLAEVDGGPVALPYYNAGSPTIAWSGPGHSGAAQNTQRSPVVSLRVRAGVPRGTLPRPGLLPAWPAKDPADVLDYQFDIAPALTGNDGDAVATLDVSITPAAPGDLRLVSAAADGARAVLWLGGGPGGTTYTVTLAIGTQAGRVLSRSVLLPVQLLSAGGSAGLLTDGGGMLLDDTGQPLGISI